MLDQCEKFQFNPYVPLLTIDGRYAWKVALDRDHHLPVVASPLVDRIQGGGLVTIPELRECFSAQEVVQLFRDWIVIDPLDEIPDQYSRSYGYWSVVGLGGRVQAVREASVLVLGAGAIGSHVAWMLTAHGVRQVVVVDFDIVESSNLNRQVLYTREDVGTSKVEALRRRLTAVNPEVDVVAVSARITSQTDIDRLLALYRFSAVVKAIDTPQEAVTWINGACVARGVPYVQGGFLAAAALIGPHYVPGRAPCWDCYAHDDARTVHHVSGGGGTTPHLTEITAGKMVRDLVDILQGQLPANASAMEVYDERTNTSSIHVDRRADECATCGARPAGAPDQVPSQLLFAVESVYLLACLLLPTLIGSSGVATRWGLAGAGVAQLALLLESSAKRGFRLAFLGGTLFSVLLTVLTVRTQPALVGLGGPIDVVGVVHALLVMAVLMALTVTAFQWLAVGVYLARTGLLGWLGLRRRRASRLEPRPARGWHRVLAIRGGVST